MSIFLIYNSDGDTIIREYTEEEFDAKLNSEDETGWLHNPMIALIENDTSYWGDKPLIIRGYIAQVKAVSHVTNWKLE